MSSSKHSTTKQNQRKPNKVTAAAEIIDLTGDGEEGVKATRVASMKSDPNEDVDILDTTKPPARLKRDDGSDSSDVEILGVFKPFSSGVDRKPAAKRKQGNSTSTRDRKKANVDTNPYRTWEVECLGTQSAEFGTKSSPSKRAKSTFRCDVCMEDALPGHAGLTLSCHHRFCNDCLAGLISSKVNDKAIKNAVIECPAPKCKTSLSTSEVQYILRDDKKAFSNYTIKANVARLEQEATTKSSSTRRCPAQHCNFIFVFEPGTGAEGTHFDCPQCHSQFCLQCGANKRRIGPAHVGMTCYDRSEQLKKEAEERKKFEKWHKENAQADQRFQELLRKERKSGKTMPCPACKTPITKNGGCHHMHCTSCNKSFNWKGK